MTDYFSEFSSYAGKGIPSPVDTPYETPSFIRSKRSSRATIGGSSREQSTSPPPLPTDTDFQEKSRDGRNGFSGMDPRRFTPTLHASLVSEILNLRRELDSKNGLVENLEASLANVKSENDSITKTLAQRANEVKKAKKQVQEMEKGTFDAVESLVQERDVAQQTAEDLKTKLESVTKKVRIQDEDALRTQGIWETEKESWENERRQLERRIHVTENRLRTFVDEMSAHQAVLEAQNTQESEIPDESTFKDSGLGQESDTASITSAASPNKHKRNMSSISSKTRSIRFSNTSRYTAGTPEPNTRTNGYSLADELGIDEEDEDEIDEYEAADDDLEFSDAKSRMTKSRQGSVGSELSPPPRRISEPTKELPGSPKSTIPVVTHVEETRLNGTSQAVEDSMTNLQVAQPKPKVQYVDTGYQPSPPSSPLLKAVAETTDIPVVGIIPTILEPTDDSKTSSNSDPNPSQTAREHALQVTTSTQVAASPISPPQTPIIAGEQFHEKASVNYSTTSTQTDDVQPRLEPPASTHASKRESLSPPMFVPAIAIHPPTSRPSSPRPYVLPPGTKNVSCQANLSWPSVDASMQTEEIRVDKRLRISGDFLRSRLLPSPTLSEPASTSQTKRVSKSLPGKIVTQLPQVSTLTSPSLLAMSPTEMSPDSNRESTNKDLRSLRALPLPRPVLSPLEGPSEGPLNRSLQYGVTRPLQGRNSLADIDADSDMSDEEDLAGDLDTRDTNGSTSLGTKAPHGRYGLSEPPKVVPEHKEISPERRPDTGESHGAAPAPSVASSRANSRATRKQPPTKLSQYGHHRSRSPSFGSFASSSFSKESNPAPPYPIPIRSSSRVLPPKTYSEGSRSPTPLHTDFFGRDHRPVRAVAGQNSLRKVQSATAMRGHPRKTSPNKHRRRRRSPNLTPVQSMAFDTPEPTQFPIPDLPIPLQEGLGEGFNKSSGSRPNTGKTSTAEGSHEAALVDAIAATMVGEWMWKYIRKRKSFGIGDEPSSFPIADQNGQMNMTAHGTRHKRWVWLSPYERTIMWDNKQPTSGSALLGKKGRKFIIQSVLDVQDNTPTPKGADLDTAFKRSILVLTPARALKFTAINHERHILWMTALSFLAQTPSVELPQSLPQELPPPLPPLRAPPPIPAVAVEADQSGRKRSPSFGRANLRDSVRLAKGRQGSVQQGTAGTDASTTVSSEASTAQDQGADFPAVPRLYSGTSRHQRKRSNTSPRLPAPLSNFRSFSANAVGSLASSSGPTNNNPTHLHPTSVRHSSSSKSGSTRESLASHHHHDRPNFFEAVGTVRMEAFVDPSVIDNVIYVPAPHQMRRQRGESTSTTDKRRAGYVFDDLGADPFRGF